MLVLKCDRCGSLNDAPEAYKTMKPPIIPKGGIVEKREHNTGTDFERFDMCELCLKSFDTWMQAGVVAPPAIVGKEQTPDPFTPVEQRATSRVPNWQKGIPEPKESLDSRS